MKFLTPLLAVIFILSLSVTGYSQSEMDMKAWTEYMTPGSVHEMIAKSDGEWNEDITFWMDPTAPPMKTTGVVVNKMILGGRYQQSNYSGDMMGMPFEGMSLLGYDNGRKIIQSIWVDNFGTGTWYSEGEWDEATKTTVLKGKIYEPLSGKMEDIKQVFKIIDDDHQSLEMYKVEDGKELKSMEIMFTRKK